MSRSSTKGDDERAEDLARVDREVAGRIAGKGVHLSGHETSQQLADLEEALERFEDAVEAHGGDLMVDEPPAGRPGEPDQERFRLPIRGTGMSVADYLETLSRATDSLGQRKRRG